MATFLRVLSCNLASASGGATVDSLVGGAALPPEMIALIRCPTSQARSLTQYCSMGTAKDHHSDDVVELLARQDLSTQIVSLDVSFISLPAVAARVTLADGSQVALCSLHLPPSTENERELFVDAIRNVLERECSRIVLIGGFNIDSSSEWESLSDEGWVNASAGHEGGGSDQSCIFRCKHEEVDATRYSILSHGATSFGIDVQLQVMTQTPLPGNRHDEEASSGLVDLCYKPPKSQMDGVESISDNGSVELAGIVQAGSKEATRDLELVDLTGEDADKYDDLQYEPPVQFMGVTYADQSSPPRLEGHPFCLHQNDGVETLGVCDGAASYGMEQQAQLTPQIEVIEPVEAKQFRVNSYCDTDEYILYCAVRERRPSRFTDALDRVSATADNHLLSFLVKEGERCVPMLALELTREQAACLAFDGNLNEIEISFDGWYENESAGSCSIALSVASTDVLANLLENMDFLPPYDEDDVLCDRLPLFLLQDDRSQEKMEEGVRKIRRTKCDWKSCSLEGVGVRLKLIDSSLDDFRELARANTSVADDPSPLTAAFRDTSEYIASPYPLVVVSWNIANAEPSCSAPDRRQRAEEAPMLIKRECQRQRFGVQGEDDITLKPDIIALQECPSPSFGTEVFGPDYKSMGQRESHSGYCELLIRNDFSAEAIDMLTPSVAALVTLPNKTRLAVASCHLSPFNDGAEERKQQCTGLTRVLAEASSNILLMGDFNMRQSEDFVVLSVGGRGWNDAWDKMKCPSDLKVS